jgi:UDP-N-acetylglucosamine 2-epimerase (non-hydrolysing)
MNNTLKIISVVGARPNFMKVAPIHRAIEKHNKDAGKRSPVTPANGAGIIQHLICHTGQHYDEKMSKVFFEDLELPKPHFYLGVGGGSHAEQTAKVMVEFEKVLLQEKPDLVLVVGDVNSTIACGLTAKKLHIKLAHVEAGLRSFDMEMPEEINRILTDRISDYLFVTEQSGLDNLKNEGVSDKQVFFVGNCMIDSLAYYKEKIGNSEILESMGLEKDEYVLVTFHRPSNVDDKESLEKLVNFLNEIGKLKKVVFPIHPRTKNNLEKYGFLDPVRRSSDDSNQNAVGSLSPSVILSDPIGYLDFQRLVRDTALVITDSGGIQEETTYLGVQCITIRNNTERPSTVDVGTNQLIGTDLDKALEVAKNVLNGETKNGRVPELWDGGAAERIVEILLEKGKG